MCRPVLIVKYIGKASGFWAKNRVLAWIYNFLICKLITPKNFVLEVKNNDVKIQPGQVIEIRQVNGYRNLKSIINLIEESPTWKAYLMKKN